MLDSYLCSTRPARLAKENKADRDLPDEKPAKVARDAACSKTPEHRAMEHATCNLRRMNDEKVNFNNHRRGGGNLDGGLLYPPGATGPHCNRGPRRRRHGGCYRGNCRTRFRGGHWRRFGGAGGRSHRTRHGSGTGAEIKTTGPPDLSAGRTRAAADRLGCGGADPGRNQ